MEITLQLSVLLSVLLLANAITGGCFSSSEKKVNSTVPWISKIHPYLFTPSEKVASNQNSVLAYSSGYGWFGQDGRNYVGAETLLDVYGFSLQPGQMSAAALQINTRVGEPHSGVQVGWMINPDLYEDSRTHFFVAWTNNGEDCVDSICYGFHKTSSSIAPGDIISPVSIPSRKVYIKLRIFKEKSSGNWHVYYGVNGDPELVGYFPKSLVPDLINKPVVITFGGHVNYEKPRQNPPMGSGDVPDSGYAASFNGLKLIDADGHYHLVNKKLQYFVDRPNCYPLSTLGNAQFWYGGPGCAN